MVFNPLKYDFSAEGGGSRPAKPIAVPRPNYGVAGPSGGISSKPTAPSINPYLKKPPPTPKPTAPVITTTSPAETRKPPPYPTVLPSLSSAQLGALAERRRLVDERLKSAQALKARDEQLLQASALRQRQGADRTSKRNIRSFMTEAAGRGLARSPMIAGRRLRTEGEDLGLKYGEIDTRLSTEIMALQDLVARASEERSMELARIEQDKVNMQANLESMFPAMYMYQ